MVTWYFKVVLWKNCERGVNGLGEGRWGAMNLNCLICVRLCVLLKTSSTQHVGVSPYFTHVLEVVLSLFQLA